MEPNTNSLRERTLTGKDMLIYPELSYKVMGSLFEVNRQLGFGFKEKNYQEAMAKELDIRGIPYKRENFSKITYKGRRIGSVFHDFIIERKIILELKVGNELYESHLKQILLYLKESGLKLGILAVFSPGGVIYKRVVKSS